MARIALIIVLALAAGFGAGWVAKDASKTDTTTVTVKQQHAPSNDAFGG